jgi:hypothetical protein
VRASTGAVASRLTVTLLLSGLPATSVAVQVYVVPVVSAVLVTASQPERLATPEVASVTVQHTDTSPVNHSVPFRGPLTSRVMTGFVASRMTVVLTVVLLPALSVAVQV